MACDCSSSLRVRVRARCVIMGMLAQLRRRAPSTIFRSCPPRGRLATSRRTQSPFPTLSICPRITTQPLFVVHSSCGMKCSVCGSRSPCGGETVNGRFVLYVEPKCLSRSRSFSCVESHPAVWPFGFREECPDLDPRIAWNRSRRCGRVRAVV